MELIWRCCFLWIVVLICAATTVISSPQEVTVTVDTTKVDNLVDERFLSLTIDPAMLLSGKDFGSEVMQLLHLAKGLSPAYLRLGSSDSNYYHYDFQNQLQQKNFTVTESDWVDLNLFAQEAGFDLIACLNIMQRAGDVWDLRESVDLIAFSDSMGYNVTWELGYELQELEKNIPAGQLGRDVVGLRQILKTFPRYQHSVIIGPDITRFKKQEDIDFLKSFFYEGENSLNVITWHPEFREYLDNEDIHKQTSLKMNYLSQDGEKLISMLNATGNMKPLWIGEKKSDSSHGLFRDALLWADKLGTAAQMSVQVIMHQPDFQVLFQPSPEYWVSLMHKSLIGRAVLKTKQTSDSNVHMYCHCTNKATPMLSNNYKPGAITFFGVNYLNTEVKVVLIGFEERQTNEEVHQYLLTSGGEGSSILDSRDTLLNGQKLSLEQGKNLPVLSPEIHFIDQNLTVTLPPTSIGFWVLPHVSVRSCIAALDTNDITSSTHEALEMNSMKDSIKYRGESQNDISTESNKELLDERMKQSNLKELNLMDRKNINQDNGMESMRNSEKIIDQDNSHFEDSFLEGKRPDIKNTGTVQERRKRYIPEMGTYVIPGLQSDLLHHSLPKSNIGIKNALWKRNRGDRFQKLSRKPKYEGNFISPFYDPYHQRSAEDMNDRFSLIFAEGRETHPFTTRNVYMKQSDGELSRERNNDYDYVDKDENAYDEDEHDPSEQEHFHGPAEFFETFQPSNVAGGEKFAGYGGELSEAESVLDSREQEEETEDDDDNEMTNREESEAEQNEAAATSMMATYYEEISNEYDKTESEEKTKSKHDRNKTKKRQNHSINYVSESEYDDGYENAERENRILRTNHKVHGTRSEDNDEIAPNAVEEYYEERERSVRRTRENDDKLKKHQKERPQTERNVDYMKSSKTDDNNVNVLKKAKEQPRKETSRIINYKRSDYISDPFDDFSEYKVKSKSNDVKSQEHNRSSQSQMSTSMRNLDDTKPKEKQLKKVVYRSNAQQFEKHNTDEENNAKTYLKKRMQNTENVKQTKMNRNKSVRRTQNNSDKVKVINKQMNYLDTNAEEDERKYLRSQEMSNEYQDESMQRSGKYYDKEVPVHENNRKTQNSNRNDNFRVKLVTNEEPRRIIRRHLLSQSSEESGSKENMWIDYIYQPNRRKDAESEKMTSREQYIIHTSNRKEMKLLNEADKTRIHSGFQIPYMKGSKIKSQIRMDDKTKNHKIYDRTEALINLKDDEPLSSDVYIGYKKQYDDMKRYSQYNIGNKVDSIKNLENTNQRFRKLHSEGSLEYFNDFNSEKLKNEIKKKQEIRSGQTDEHDGTKIILPTDNSMEANKKQTLRTNAVKVLNNSNEERSQSTASVIGQDEFSGIVTIPRTETQKDTRKNSRTSSDLDTIQKLDKTKEKALNLEMYENELNSENAVVRLPKAVDDRLNLKYITSKVMNKGNKYGFIKSGIEQENGDFGKSNALSVELPLQKFQVEETGFLDKQSPTIGDAILLHRNSVPIFTPRKLISLPEKKEVSGKFKNLRWNKIPDEITKSHSSEVENSTQANVTENTEFPQDESLRIPVSDVKTEEVSTQQTPEEEQTTQQIPEEGQTTLQTYTEEQQIPEEKQEALEQVDQKLASDVGQEIFDDIVTISALISEQIPILEDSGDIEPPHMKEKHSIQESSESEMGEVTKKLPVPVIDNIRNGVHSIIDQIGTTVRKASHSFKDDSKESETLQDFKDAHDNVKKIEDKIFQYTYGMMNSRNGEDGNNRNLSFESEKTDDQDRIERNAEEDFSGNRHTGSKLQEFQSNNDADGDNFADPLVRNAKDIEHLNLLATKNILSNTNDVAKLQLSAFATKEQIKAELEKKRLEALHALNTHRAKLKEDLLKKKVLISDGILKLGHHVTRRDTESVMKMYQQSNKENHGNKVDTDDSHISEEQNKESTINMKENDNYLYKDNSWLAKIFSPESIIFMDSGEIPLDSTFHSEELNFPRHSESQMVLTDGEKQSGADTFRIMDFESNPLFVLLNLEHHADLSERPFHKELHSSEDADSKTLDSTQERNTEGESLEIHYVEMKQVPLPLYFQRPQLGRDPIMMQFYSMPTNENDIRFYLNSALEDSEDLTRTQRYSSSVMQSTENDSEVKEEFSMSLSSESEDSDKFESQHDDILSKEINQMTSSVRSENEIMKNEYKPRNLVNEQMQSEQNNMQISELDVPLSQGVTKAYEKNFVSDVEITLSQDIPSKSVGTHGPKTIHINSKRSKRSPTYESNDILDNDLFKPLVTTKKEDPWTEDKMNYKYNVYSFLRNVPLGSDKETTSSKLVISNMLPENTDDNDLINMAKIEYELNHVPIGGHNITVIVDDSGLKNESITSNGTFAETFDSEAENNSVNDVNIETNEIIRKYKENLKFEKDIGNIRNEKDGSIVEIREIPYKIYKSSFRKKYDPSDNKLWRYLYKPLEANSEELINTDLSSDSNLFKGIGKRLITSDEVSDAGKEIFSVTLEEFPNKKRKFIKELELGNSQNYMNAEEVFSTSSTEIVMSATSNKYITEPTTNEQNINKVSLTSSENKFDNSVENVNNDALKPMFEALETDPKAEEYANNASEIERDYKSEENEEMQHFESHEKHKPTSTTENIGKVIKNFTNHIIKFLHKISPWNYFVH